MEIAEAILEEEIVMGVLLYADITDSTNFSDDRTAHCFLDIMNNTINALKDPIDVLNLMYTSINSNCEYNDPTAWYEQNALSEESLFIKRYRTEFLNRKPGSDKLELTQMYFFSTYAEYFVFCIITFYKAAETSAFLQMLRKLFYF